MLVKAAAAESEVSSAFAGWQRRIHSLLLLLIA